MYLWRTLLPFLVFGGASQGCCSGIAWRYACALSELAASPDVASEGKGGGQVLGGVYRGGPMGMLELVQLKKFMWFGWFSVFS